MPSFRQLSSSVSFIILMAICRTNIPIVSQVVVFIADTNYLLFRVGVVEEAGT